MIEEFSASDKKGDETMARKGEIVIDEENCMGCGYCVLYCPKECMEIARDRFNVEGYLPAVFTRPEECTACGNCVIMCPQFAIEVYLLADEKERRN